MIKNNCGNLLMVGNFSSSTGYAWNMICSCFCALGRYFIQNNRKAYVCFPKVDILPKKYIENNIEIIEFDFYGAGFFKTIKFIRNNDIGTVYLIDRGFYSFKYVILRVAGVRKIIVHDHTSGERSSLGLVKKNLKKLRSRFKLISADHMVAISDYVKKRQIDIAYVAQSNVSTIYNGVDLSSFSEKLANVYDLFNIPIDKKIILCCGRANYYKGIEFFIKAADLLINKKKRHDMIFLYCGDGPDFHEFIKLIKKYRLDDSFRCPGYVDFTKKIYKVASVCVVPSVWQEGFGLVVIESMAAGTPVIASKIGGMAEIIDDGVDGFYVEPGDFIQIAYLIEKLVDDKELKKKISRKSIKKVTDKFDIEYQKTQIVNVFKRVCEI